MRLPDGRCARVGYALLEFALGLRPLLEARGHLLQVGRHLGTLALGLLDCLVVVVVLVGVALHVLLLRVVLGRGVGGATIRAKVGVISGRRATSRSPLSRKA